QVERVVVGGARLERRAALQLDAEVTPLVGGEARELRARLRRRELRDLPCALHDLAHLEVEEELAGLRLPAALAVPDDDALAVGAATSFFGARRLEPCRSCARASAAGRRFPAPSGSATRSARAAVRERLALSASMRSIT